MQNKPTILIVEDSDPTRLYIENAIIEGQQFEILASVSNYTDAVEILRNSSPSILLTDIDLPDGNGIDLIKMLLLPDRQRSLAIVISIFADGPHVINALKAGASGYLLKDDNYFDMNNAISQVLSGGSPISPGVARYVLDELTLSPLQKITNRNKKKTLTSRESEVLIFVSKGYTSKEIAKALGLSPHTVKDYVSNIYKKLQVNNKIQAVNEATIQGYI